MRSPSSLRLDLADLERLLARYPLPHASGIRVAREEDRLRLHVADLQLPTPLMPSFPATLDLKAGLVEGARNVVAVHLRADELPLGLQVLANAFLDKVVERILPRGASAYVEVRSPSLLWVRLERIPDYGRPFADAVTLTDLRIPGGDGAALEASFTVRGDRHQ